jgi:penicillin-binding protein 2
MSEQVLFPSPREPFGSTRCAPEEGTFVPDRNFSEEGMYVGLTVPHRRFFVLSMVCLALFLLFTVRAFVVQVVSGAQYQSLAEGNRLRIVRIPAARGILFDRNGTPLVENAASFGVSITAADLPTDQKTLNDARDTLARYGISREEWDATLSAAKRTPFEIVAFGNRLSYEQAVSLEVAAVHFSGLSVHIATERRVLDGATEESMAHLIGYIGRISPNEFATRKGGEYSQNDRLGKTGLEQSLETTLRGRRGYRQIEVDAVGRERRIISAGVPQNGTNVRLSIDAQAQEFLEQRVKDALRQSGARRAAAVAMDPQNGEIIALVSLPGYDPNLFSAGISSSTYAALHANPDHPLFPRAIAGQYPSGSTFKPIVAVAALAEKIITPQTTVLSTGGLWFQRTWFFPDWKAGGHGITDVYKAVAESVNTFFYMIGGGTDQFSGLGPERLARYAKRFGFGSPLGIPLPGESSGLVPTEAWKKETRKEQWYIGDTYHFAIGQGDLLVTPLQVAAMTAALANGGSVWQPRLVHAVSDGNDAGWTAATSTLLADNSDLTKEIAVVKDAMRATVTRGSARSLQSVPVAVAGKTGTAQTTADKKPHAWFTGYAPAPDPKLVVTVLIEEGGEGSSIAVPVARSFLTWYFTHPSEATSTAVFSTSTHS